MAAAKRYMADGAIEDQSARIMRTILDAERASGYEIPEGELRDLWAFSMGYIEAARRVRDAERERCANICAARVGWGQDSADEQPYPRDQESMEAWECAQLIRTPAQPERGPAPKAEGDERAAR